MKIFTAGLITESSDLTPIPTTSKQWILERSCDDESDTPTLFRELLILFREMAIAKDWEVYEGVCAAALPPGGRIVRSVYENLRKMILDDLQKAMPVDGVLLQLHGAALAHGYDDCEGDLLENIRLITGPDIPIGVELDPHCHISDRMMEHATAIILYKTFMHTIDDIKDRAVELFNLIADTLEGRVKPVMAIFDCRMVDLVDDTHEPMKSFLETIYAREREPGILSISPVHGCPLADIPDMGSKMLVITDDDLDLAVNTAQELGLLFYEIRGQQFQYLDIETALDRVQLKAAKKEMSIKLVEWSDLVGCGFPTDGTELLSAMLARDMTNVVVGLMWDPLAVSICHDAEQGAELTLRIGGKACQYSGTPMDLHVVVDKLYKNRVISTWQLGHVNLGDVAVVRCGETEIILVSERVLGYDEQTFRDLGVDPGKKQFLLAKYMIASDVIHVWGSSFNLKKRSALGITRPKWPWDQNPL